MIETLYRCWNNSMSQRDHYLNLRWNLLQQQEDIYDKLTSRNQYRTAVNTDSNVSLISETSNYVSKSMHIVYFIFLGYSKMNVKAQIQNVFMKNANVQKIKKKMLYDKQISRNTSSKVYNKILIFRSYLTKENRKATEKDEHVWFK